MSDPNEGRTNSRGRQLTGGASRGTVEGVFRGPAEPDNMLFFIQLTGPRHAVQSRRKEVLAPGATRG